VKNKRLLAGVGSLLALIVFFFAYRSCAGNSTTKNSQAEQQRLRMRSFDDPTQELSQLAKNADVPFSKVLADFREWAQYPPDSRPLSPLDTDQIRFEKIELPLMPMPIVEEGKPKEAQHACVLQAESHTAYEDMEHETKLRCQNLANGKWVMPDVRAVKMTRTSATVTVNTLPPEMRKNDNPPHIAFLFRPRQQDWGDMELTVDFALPDENSPHIHQLKTHFFSSPQAPAKFTGNFRERLDKGSLIIQAELQVRLVGNYRLEANLLAADGTPVAHARSEGKLGGGTQWAEFLFFGKVLRDSRQPGPYKLTGLRGQQLNLPINPEMLSLPPEQVEKILASTEQTEPIKRAIIPWIGEYRTEAYQLNQFSDAEWDSEFKRERIKELERLAAAE